MSWFALLPTIVAAVILVALILTRSEKPNWVTDAREQAGEPTRASTSFPSLTAWLDALRDARQPVWPLDKVAFEAQARRGMVVAGAMAIMVFVAALEKDQNDFVLIGFIVGVVPVAGVAMAFGALHSIIVRLMPYRGPIISTVIGTLIGFATMLATRNPPAPLTTKLIYVGAVYGLIVGAIEFAMPPEKAKQQRSGRSPAKARTRA